MVDWSLKCDGLVVIEVLVVVLELLGFEVKFSLVSCCSFPVIGRYVVVLIEKYGLEKSVVGLGDTGLVAHCGRSVWMKFRLG